MKEIVIYQKPTCSKCRELYKILKDKKVDFESVDYYLDPIDKNKLLELLSKMNCSAADIIRTKEAVYQDLDLKNKDLSEDELVEIIVTNPDLMQRPIVEVGDNAILARPPEKVLDIL